MASSVPDELIDAIEQARSAPDADEAWDVVDEIARSTQRPEEVSKLYLDVLSKRLPRELVAKLGERAVAFHEEWFEDPVHVITILQRVLSTDPGAEWAFERLSLLLTMAERWDDLLETYDRALEATDDVEQKKKLLDEAARIAKDFAGQTNRAIDYLKELVPLRPEDAQLAQSLERRLVLQKRYRDLIDVWNARLGVMEAAEALSTRVRTAETWLEKLNDAAQALETVHAIIELPDGEEPACRLLEQIGTTREAPDDIRRASLLKLKETFIAADKPREVVRTIELLLDVAKAAEELTALRSEACERLAAMSMPEEAVEHGAEWLVLDPSRPVRDRLRDLVDQTSRYERYVDALVRAAGASQEDELRAELIVEAGRVSHDRLNDYPRAIELYTRALADTAPTDEAQLDVSRRLTELLVGPEHAQQRLQVLERRADLEPELENRRRVLGEAAMLADNLGDPDHALVLWRRRLTEDAADMEALDASAGILERLTRWEPFIAILEQRADAHGATDPQARRADFVRIADVYEAQLGDTERAIEVWRRIQDEFGSNVETVDALANLSAAARRWTDVVGLLRAAADTEEDPTRRADRLSRMGDVYRLERSAPTRAVEAYHEALEIEPTHAHARAGLIELLAIAEAARDAVETLAKAYRSADEWEKLVDLVERRLELASEDGFRKEALVEASRIQEERAGDKAAALEFMRRAFALSAHEDTEAEVRRLAEETGNFAAAASGYAEAIGSAPNAARRRELLYDHGRILEEKLGDPRGALESYVAVLESDPSNVPAACAAARTGCRTEQWEAAARAVVACARKRKSLERDVVESFDANATRWDEATAAFDAAIEGAKSLKPRVAHDLLRQLAIWHRDRREDFDAAEAAFERAVAQDSDAETLQMLAEIQRRAPGRKLVTTLLRLADATGDDLDVLHEAGSVALYGVQDSALARPILERVLEVASKRWRQAAKRGAAGPLDEERFALWALDQLVRLRLEAGEATQALFLLTDGATLPCAPEKSRSLRFEAARIASERLNDSPKAVELCAGILDEAPDHADGIGLLSAIYSKDGRLEDLLELRRRELALVPPIERRLTLRLDIARVLGDLGGAPSDRVSALKANLVDRPGHEPTIVDLATILETESRHAELFDVYSEQAKLVEHAGDPGAAASLWARGGKLAETALGEVDRALDAYRRSVALTPSLTVLDSLARIHADRGEHSIAVHWLEQRLARTERGPEEIAGYRDTVLRLARAQRSAGQEERARRTLREALAGDPAARKLREFLAEMYREAGDWRLLAPLLADGVDYAKDVESKIELLSQAAQVHRRRLGEVEAAIPLLERAVELAPSERPARLALADALRVAKRYPEAQGILHGLLEEFGRRRTPERAEVHFNLARIAHAQSDLNEALVQLESASSIERSDPQILKLLGDVARQKGELEQAERAYRALLLIVRRQHAAHGETEDAIAASEILYELYRIALEQGQTDRAHDLLESAYETAAENNLEALRLERVFRASGQTDLVLRVLDTRLERIAEPAAAADILCARAELLADTGRLGEALETLLEALDRTPESDALVRSTHELAVRAGAVDRYVDRLANLAEKNVKDKDRASALWLRLGHIAETELADTNRAVSFYEHGLATGARTFRAYQALMRLIPEDDIARRMDAMRRFVDTPERERDEPEERTEALYRLARAELSDASTAELGLRHLEQALARQHRLEEARQALSLGVEVAPENAAIIGLYERIARDLADRAMLLDAMARRARLPGTDIEHLRNTIDLARELGDERRLAAALERLVVLVRENGTVGSYVWALTELSERRQAAGDFSGAVELLQEASSLSDASDAFEYDLRVADLAAGPLDRPTLAAETYERLLDREPSDARVWTPLLELYRRLGAREKLEACIAKTIDVVYDPAQRNQLRMERGRILLEDPARVEEAEMSLRQVLEEDPDHVQAASVLSELLERSGRVHELNEIFQRQLTMARERGDSEAVATLTLRIGANLKQGNREDAIHLYKESLEYAPDNRALLTALLGLYGPEDDAAERATIMEKLLAVEQGEAAAELALQLAALRRSLGDMQAAERALSSGFKACPEREDLKERLAELYTERQDWAKLADLLSYEAAHRTDPAEIVASYRRAAELYQERLLDPARAAQMLARARDVMPGDVALLSDLVNALTAAGDISRALEALSSAVDQEELPPAARASVLATRARLRLTAAHGDLAVLNEAVADFERANELAGFGLESEYADVLEQQRQRAAEAGDEVVERQATMRLTALLPALGDHRRGLELLVSWVKRKPDDADAVRGLGRFAAQAEKWGAAAKAYQRLVEITQDEEQIEAVLSLAEASERAGSPMDARSALEQVYARAPDNEKVRSRLRRMYEAAEAYQELASIMMQEAEHASDPEIQFQRFVEAGDVSLRVQGGQRTAIVAFQRALAIKPEDHRTTMRLAETLANVGDIEQAATLLDAAINAHGKKRSPELSELQYAMAKVGRLAEDYEAVFAWLEAAMQSDRQNGSAAAELAILAMDQNELETAMRALQAITLLKEPGPMSRAEAYLRQGIIAERRGDRKKAVFLARRALTTEPEYGDAKSFLEQLGES